MKTIAWVLDTFPSPTETFIARDIEALRARGFSIEVFALRAGEGARALEYGRIRPYFRNRWQVAGERLGEITRRERIAHIHAGWASHPAEIARIAAQRATVSWSFSAHARDIWVEGGDLRSKLESAAFAAACTHAGAKALGAHSSKAQILYAPHGLDLAQWPFAPRTPQSAPLILGVGRLVEKKGWNIWLEALALLDDSSWHAELLGEGPQQAALEKQARRLNLQNRVRFAGAVSTDAVRVAMQLASMVVFAGVEARDGDRDGLPNVLLEAAALGVPIVATRSEAIEEFGSDALQLCTAGSAAALCDAMRAVLNKPEEAAERATLARAVIESRFDMRHSIAPLAHAFSERGLL
ncbi:MAG TPA: glycosyltransferase [Abditibacteriaceae bacterium]|jgi:glycosyltransferase involved in cell wall biosynthesis